MFMAKLIGNTYFRAALSNPKVIRCFYRYKGMVITTGSAHRSTHCARYSVSITSAVNSLRLFSIW